MARRRIHRKRVATTASRVRTTGPGSRHGRGTNTVRAITVAVTRTTRGGRLRAVLRGAAERRRPRSTIMTTRTRLTARRPRMMGATRGRGAGGLFDTVTGGGGLESPVQRGKACLSARRVSKGYGKRAIHLQQAWQTLTRYARQVDESRPPPRTCARPGLRNDGWPPQ